MRIRLFLACALFAAITMRDARAAEIIRGTDEFEFTYRVVLPEIRGSAQLWLPIAKSDAFQTVAIRRIEVPGKWKRVEDRDFGNQIMLMSPTAANGGGIIEITYAVKRAEKGAYEAAGAELSRYLRPERLVPADKTFSSLAKDAAKDAAMDLERGRALYRHVLDRMRYDKTGEGWGRGDALRACNARTGNCTDFHAYFIALSRALGIPARFAIGMTIPAERNEGEIAGYHCWAEFCADGKWVPVDISEASRHPALADYYFGHHPANRLELSVGRDLSVDPQPASGLINFLVYPLLEVDGQPVKAESAFRFRRTKL